MHDIMGQQDKWQSSVEQTIKVSHQIYSLSDDCTSWCTLFGASKYLFFGVPMALGIVGFLLHLFGNTASLVGGIIHIVVATWILVTYLLWVYGILGFHLSPETLHSSRVMMKYSSQHGCFGVYVRILRYRPNFKDERKSAAAVHPMKGSNIKRQSEHSSAGQDRQEDTQQDGQPGRHQNCRTERQTHTQEIEHQSSTNNNNFISKAWT